MRLQRAIKKRKDAIDDKLVELNEKGKPYLEYTKYNWLGGKEFDPYNRFNEYINSIQD